MSDARWHVLDLFAGLGGFSAAFSDSDNWAVTAVDIEGRFDPDIQTDVMDLRPSDFDRDFDVVLSSPPCTYLTMAQSAYGHFRTDGPHTPEARETVCLVYHTLGLIQAINPEFWFLENPKGWLRHVIGDPVATVTYCQYGEDYMKPTDLWGEHPPMTYKRCNQGDPCHAGNTSGETMDTAHMGENSSERAKVPYDLSEAIKNACETALTTEQGTIDAYA